MQRFGTVILSVYKRQSFRIPHDVQVRRISWVVGWPIKTKRIVASSFHAFVLIGL